MYYVENNHPAIIPREIFAQVQEEMKRRSSKRKVMQKHGKTERGKYSGKYALTELLVCGKEADRLALRVPAGIWDAVLPSFPNARRRETACGDLVCDE